MHELMRERFWNLFVAIKHQCYYYRFFKKHCDNKIAALKIFLTAVSCAGISAWAIWDFLPGALPVVLAAAQILSVCQDYFPFAKQSTGIEYLLPDLELLCISIETDWNKIEVSTLRKEDTASRSFTNKQFKIWRAVIKYRTLGKILKKTKIKDYQMLQIKAGTGNLDFLIQNEIDENTVIVLSHDAQCQYESHIRYFVDITFTRIIAIIGAVTGTTALALDIMQRFQ